MESLLPSFFLRAFSTLSLSLLLGRYLPTDLCRKHKVNYGQVQQGYNSDALSEVMFQVAARAKAHLDEARRAHGALPGDLKPFLLPCVPALAYVHSLAPALCPRPLYHTLPPRICICISLLHPSLFGMRR